MPKVLQHVELSNISNIYNLNMLFCCNVIFAKNEGPCCLFFCHS